MTWTTFSAPTVTFLHHLEQVYGTKPSAETISRLPIKYWSRWRFLDDKSDAKPKRRLPVRAGNRAPILSASLGNGDGQRPNPGIPGCSQ
jgi:hypothetical protein